MSALSEEPLKVVACVSAGIFVMVTRACDGCGHVGEQIAEYHGVFYGHDYHCLTCGVTDRDGSLRAPDPALQERWGRIAERYLVPVELYQRYLDSEQLVQRAQTAVAERRAFGVMQRVVAEMAVLHQAADELFGNGPRR